MKNKGVYCLFLIVILVMIFGARKNRPMPNNVVNSNQNKTTTENQESPESQENPDRESPD